MAAGPSNCKDGVDQLVPGKTADGCCVKSKPFPNSLPRARKNSREEYPEYFRQLAAYLRMADLTGLSNGQPLTGELVFVDFAAGVVQTVALSLAEAGALAEEQLHDSSALFGISVEFAPDAWQRCPRKRPLPYCVRVRLKHRPTSPPWPGHPGVFMFEAPTGFGKTGLLLEYALARLRDGHCHRLLYLTGKGTGQTPITRQLRALLGAEPELRFLQLRSRREHAIASPRHTCDVRRSCRE